MLFWATGIAVAAWAAWKSSEGQDAGVARHQQFEGFTVTRTPVTGDQEMIRLRGSYDDIMRALGVVTDEKPTLPEGLDVDSLPEYHCGCPHCGKVSVMSENMWRYQELSRTRGPYDNTTTFLAKCKKCEGFMRSTVDHDD